MKTQTFNISLPQELVKEADKVAAQEFRNRSELIKEALRKYIQQKSQWELVLKEGEVAGKSMGFTNEEEISNLVEEYRHGTA